jgi:penicillin amidase
MRIVFFILSLLVTVCLILVLDTRLLLPAPLGQLLSPQQGIWQNAEAVEEDFNGDFHFPQLRGKTEVFFDERLVPHIFAEDENDAFFVQGFLHAKFRLWQMEFQTHAAGGRLSEILGDQVNGKDVLNRADRFYRRLGLKWAAERALEVVEKDEETKAQMDAYTAGVNAYIKQLPVSQIPVEYKLLGYQPELWTNLKTILFLKYMSYDLAGGENDFEHTNMKTVFGIGDYELLFPTFASSMDPVVPKETLFAPPGIQVQQPANVDSLYLQRNDSVSVFETRPDKDNGGCTLYRNWLQRQLCLWRNQWRT